jgi:tetratricopeptide (TPR) repeat protein
MTSIVPGFEYDIFISYRQKDNKGDRWVSEFVDSLKTELESTFKEEISVYFDINPHDGLLETHDVDASLKDKLKCLVFIPIISRTYCDPKSFAWEHEFKAFVELASQDQFGLKIRIPNGNITSRVLPIRIHDLDSADIKQCESVLGGVLRGIEFIYKEAGIDKPLAPGDDEKKNLKNTKYRIQIVKVAHAIKDIIPGMKTEPRQVVKEKDHPKELFIQVMEEESRIDVEKTTKIGRGRIFIPLVIVAFLIVAGIIAYPKIFKQDSLEKLRSKKEISIAVMPFQNMTNDTIWKVWQSGIQDILITSLSNSEVFKVNQTELTNYIIQSRGLTNYASITPSIAREISQKLEADIFILGSIKEAGSTIRLNAQLIDSKTGEIFKSFEIDAPANENIILQISDSLRNMVTNFLIISELGEDWPFARSFSSITNSPEAFRYFTYGHKSSANGDYLTASDWYLKALTVDSTFTLAAGFLSWSYYNQDLYGQAKKVCMEVYKKRNVLPLKTKIVIDWFHAIYFETPYEEIKYMKQFIELDDHVQLAYSILGGCYNTLGQFENAIPEFEKCLEICEKWWSQPLSVHVYTNLGYAYHKTGQFKKEKKLYEEAERDFPDDYSLLSMQATLALSEGKTKKADEYIGKYLAFRKEMSTSEATIASSLGAIYQDAGIMAKAEEYYRQALSLEPDNPNGYDYLAYFLLDNDRNIKEGLQLVDAALISDPEDFKFLHTKGWGLYKQGKYKEALEILQKSWDLRRKNAIYDHSAFLHLEAAKKAVAGQKN